MTLRIINAKETKLTGKDFRELAEIEEHPDVARWDTPFYGGDVERTTTAFKEYFQNLSKSQDECLVAKLDGKVVGFAGIHRLKGEAGEMAHVGEVGIAVHPDFQRRGIGTKLLKECVSLAARQGFKRLEADTLAHNMAMRRILEKVGFKLEGVRQERIRRGKEYHDEACYAIIT